MRVQQEIVRSGRKTVSQRSYETIPLALSNLKYRMRIVAYENPNWTIYTNYDDKFWFENENGYIMRIFTLVAKKGSEPIPFGHLLKRGRG